ncbi:MAG: bifunctional transaldolase/phosoglucose isomerase, partial [Halobacteriota archaeon]|nr:bifunctional transaldolase/phosoglucose isomerase [Halobacteriota archaeon]
VYQRFKEIFTSNRWKELEEKGARVQRVLWASTGTKNPEYSDVVYVEELILKDTINTMPPATMNAFLDHGNVKDSLESGVEEADANIKKLESLGIDLDNLTEKLQVEGVNAFEQSYDKLIETLEEKRKAILQGQKERMELCLGKYQRPVDDRLKVWKEMRFNRRLWDKDPSLWFDEPVPEITNRLGWLNLPEMMHEHLDELASFAEGVKDDGISHVVLLGMGGSSLAPGVFKSTFGSRARYPELMVLDSTHPDAIIEIQKRVDLRRTLFIVASKSGTTLEPTSLFKFFWEQVKGLIEDPGSRFIAITDPGTPLVKVAEEKRFRRLFLAPTDLGGRFSALTVFGLVPAALIGVNLHRLLDRAWVAAEGCAFCVEEDKVSGLILGAALGELALRGVDKVTFITTPSIRSFPNWLEQLIAESTGKEGKGIIPVASEVLQDKKSHKEDRFFVYLFVEGEEDEDVKGTVKALEDAGHPIARIGLADRYDIGMEIFRWELAVASAGSVMGIHPFNQPDVELAKELAREAMKGDNVAAVDDLETISIEENDRLTSEIEGLLNQAGDRDYIAIQAYIQPSEKADELLSSIRMKLFESLGLATTSGYGPRFLHSTGQLHKGGPDTGLFIQLVDEPSEGLSVPDSGYTFRDIIAAQSFGDFHALVKIGRKVLRVNLKEDAIDGLSIILDLL